MKFYTIGYGGREPRALIDLLKVKGIKTIVDVRLRPDRASMGLYKKTKSESQGIQGLLAKAGISYVSWVQLGNVFIDREDWPEKYRMLLEKAGDILVDGLEHISPNPFCLMCAEKSHLQCHRGLISDFLVQKGYEVEHIE